MSGIEQMFADCRTANDSGGSIRVTLPKPLAEEWEIEDGDSIPFVAHEGEDTAEIRRPGATSDDNL